MQKFNLQHLTDSTTVFLVTQAGEVVSQHDISVLDFEPEATAIVLGLPDPVGYGYLLFYFNEATGEQQTPADADGTELTIMVAD